MGTVEHVTWNNEADAFKHAYMQAQLSLWASKHIAKALGDFHEFQGNKTMGQSKEEYNMDNWNNEQGREIAREIIQQYGVLSTIPSQKINDIIAEKVVKRMREEKLILSPNNNRKYENYKNNNYHSTKTTGQAAPIVQNQLSIFGYTNPLTGSNHIYTREEVGRMSKEEFAKHEKEINAQTKYFNGTMPTNGDLQQEAMIGGGAMYVNSYTRFDGTKVSGYYRSK